MRGPRWDSRPRLCGVKVSIVRGGGIGGFVTKTTLAADALPAERAEGLRSRAGAARSAAGARSEQPAPDAFVYEVTVEDEDGASTILVDDAAAPAPVRDLIDFVGSAPEREERSGPPGSVP